MIAVGGCGSSTPTGPEWWTTTPVEAAVTVLTVTVDPAAVVGTGSVRGTVRLNRPAPAGGAVVALASSSEAAVVPASLNVAAGSVTADFTIETHAVAEDTNAIVTARLGDRAPTAVVGVWAILPMSLTVTSEPGEFIGRNRTHRFTLQDSTFHAECHGSDLEATVVRGSSRWSLEFGAPRGTPLRPGVYENATRAVFRSGGSPGLDVNGDSSGCNQVFGRFEVTEAVFAADGAVQRFVATFEQRCGPSAPALRGELRLESPPFVPFPETDACLR
jgi:hypothetical protein